MRRRGPSVEHLLPGDDGGRADVFGRRSLWCWWWYRRLGMVGAGVILGAGAPRVVDTCGHADHERSYRG